MSNKHDIVFLEPSKKNLKKGGKPVVGKSKKKKLTKTGKGDVEQVEELFNKFAPHLTKEQETNLRRLTKLLMEPGKGILSADDSVAQIDGRLKSINLDCTVDNRERFQELILGAGRKLSHFLSGILMKEEIVALRVSRSNKTGNILKDAGIQLGLRADKGVIPVSGMYATEYFTQGLDDIESKLGRYKDFGATFSLFRCVFKVSEWMPTQMVMQTNCNTLACFAAGSQRVGLVPIMSTEVLTIGAYDEFMARDALHDILTCLVKTLQDYHVYLEAVIIRLTAAVPGDANPLPYDLRKIAEASLAVINECLPPAIGGIMLARSSNLSRSIDILNELNKCPIKKPIPISFCYSQVIQEGIVNIWSGLDVYVSKAQEELIRKAKMCSLGSMGQFPDTNMSLFISNITSF